MISGNPGGKPASGEKAAEVSRDEIAALMKDTDMLFVVAGMGGGVGTGATPVIAQMAKDEGILTVGVVTRPFLFEGKLRKDKADAGIAKLEQSVDALITISSEKMLEAIDNDTSIAAAFQMIDAAMMQKLQAFTDLLAPELVSIDFVDMRMLMKDIGEIQVGVGQASGEALSTQAALVALSSVQHGLSVANAKKLLVCISGDETLTLDDVEHVLDLIKGTAGSLAEVELWSQDIEMRLNDTLKVTIIASGFERD